MSTLIKGGTIVAADRSYVSDILIEGESIKAIGTGLSGDKVVDASDCLIMPGGIDPHTHLDMPFMGTSSSDNYDSGTRAALWLGPDEQLLLLTTDGLVKKTPLKAFQSISARGMIAIKLAKGDKLKRARRCNPTDEILVASR